MILLLLRRTSTWRGGRPFLLLSQRFITLSSFFGRFLFCRMPTLVVLLLLLLPRSLLLCISRLSFSLSSLLILHCSSPPRFFLGRCSSTCFLF